MWANSGSVACLDLEPNVFGHGRPGIVDGIAGWVDSGGIER